MPAPGVEFPYFPAAHSEKGEVLMQAYSETLGDVPLVAHQLCALQMFQARITRSRYASDLLSEYLDVFGKKVALRMRALSAGLIRWPTYCSSFILLLF
jgi:hypothetical protein